MQLALFDVDGYQALWRRNFEQSELGRVFLTIPFRELASKFQIKKKANGPGANPIFSVEGALGLMFLKHYTGLSDEKLIAQVNVNWHYQCFCGLAPQIDYRIRDKDIVGRWRRFFGSDLNIDELQQDLAQSWKNDLPHLHINMQDATVYESYIKYPTDLKLLWDCLMWLRGQMRDVCKAGGFAMPRSKYSQRYDKYISFAKRRKKTHKLERRHRKAALYLLDKMKEQFQTLLNNWGRPAAGFLSAEVRQRLKTLRLILVQQQYHFQHPEKSVPQRIVSFHKPYLRPIVRGKENKPVEFGAKVHQVQVGGCNFIEHLDFEAFHEGNRLKKGVWMHRRLFGEVRQLSADGIYATNRNRKWCRLNQIATNFIPKGAQGPLQHQAKALRHTLSTIRATRLEGSFGNEKNHYLLRKVRARTQPSEIAWIFFGVHCANAVKVAKARAGPQAPNMALSA